MAGAIERQLTIMLDQQIGPEAMAARLAAFSKRQLARVIARGEGSPYYETIVNGTTGAREESVKPPGDIVHLFNWWPQVLIFGIQFLRQRSPASSPDSPRGRLPYRDRFFVLANGTGVNPRQYHTIPLDAEVIIGNSAPYHRKIDVQMIGREPVRINVPPGIMEDAAQAIATRFGSIVTAKRTYTLFFSGQYEIRRGPDAGKFVHSPGIVITRKGL